MSKQAAEYSIQMGKSDLFAHSHQRLFLGRLTLARYQVHHGRHHALFLDNVGHVCAKADDGTIRCELLVQILEANPLLLDLPLS